MPSNSDTSHSTSYLPIAQELREKKSSLNIAVSLDVDMAHCSTHGPKMAPDFWSCHSIYCIPSFRSQPLKAIGCPHGSIGTQVSRQRRRSAVAGGNLFGFEGID